VTAALPAEELATLLRLVGSANGPSEPLVALPWAPVGAGAADLIKHAARRTGLAASSRVATLGSGRRPRVVRPLRGSLSGGLRDRLRRGAGGGYVAVLPSDDPSLLDILLADAGAVAHSGLSVGADGAVRVLARRDGSAGLLRMGLTGTPADPSHAAEGLERVATAGSGRVPVVLASGRSGEVTWLLESLLPGQRPRVLSPSLLDDVAEFVAGLPPGSGPADVREDASVLSAAAPTCADALRHVADLVAGSPLAERSRLRHGDLWSGNLLAAGDGLTGVVDWDAWSPAGVPAVDLLHLLATEVRIRNRVPLGEVWLQRPWDGEVFTRLARSHWPEWGGDAAARAVVGLAWWTGQLAADLRRNPALAANSDWVGRNIVAVATEVTAELA
jgi:hypothetical protein